jgi:hypothetical protein
MISCNLQGGLGNQMFQIAAATSLAISNNDVYSFNFEDCFTPNQGNKSTKYVNNIFKNIPIHSNFNFDKIYNEPKFSFSKIPYQKNLLINGYFQSQKYFEDNSTYIKKLFYINDNDIKKISDKYDVKNLTCVHIRRGDYLKFKDFHFTCDINYYQNAMDLIKDTKFIFISDDMDWVKSNFKSDNFLYSKLNDEILDFTLITMCKNVIISNSSFSWWGSYLNNNNGKIIAPKMWFGPSGHKDTQDVIPNDWIIIDN